MITVTRTGTGAALAADLRDLTSRRVATVTAIALTKATKAAQADIIKAMPGVFAGGATPYTLNSTRVETATRDKLQARVAVKDRSSNNGTLPEDYLLPQVFGGARKEKRMERNLRFGGILQAGQRAVLGRDTPATLVDAYGNLKRGEIQRILTAVRASFDRYQNRSTSARSRRNAANAPYFVQGLPRGRFSGGEYRVKPGTVQPGVYRRVGPAKQRKVVPVLVFVSKAPTYNRRLDFEGIARAAALREFEPEFVRLLAQPRAGA
jgi:hypothetical protein